MKRYFVITESGHRIVHGDWLEAVSLAKTGCPVKTIPPGVDDDDVIYGRVSYDDLPF